MVCSNCGKTLVDDEKHIMAPSNRRGVKCLVLLNLARELGLERTPDNKSRSHPLEAASLLETIAKS